MNFATLISLTPEKITTWWRIWQLKRVHATALKSIDVSQAIVDNGLACVNYFQDIEMETRRELRQLGVEIK